MVVQSAGQAIVAQQARDAVGTRATLASAIETLLISLEGASSDATRWDAQRNHATSRRLRVALDALQQSRDPHDVVDALDALEHVDWSLIRQALINSAYDELAELSADADDAVD